MSTLKSALITDLDGALVRAKRHLEAGELAEAETLFMAIRDAGPNRWEGHLGLAQVYLLSHRVTECLQVLPEAMRVSPDCLPAYQLMAHLGIEGGVSDAALEWLEFGAQHLSSEPLLFEWMITLYAMENRMDDLSNCLDYYGRLRGMGASEVAMIFARTPDLSEDIRSRIAQAAGF